MARCCAYLRLEVRLYPLRRSTRRKGRIPTAGHSSSPEDAAFFTSSGPPALRILACTSGSLDRPQEKILLLRSPTNAIYVPDRGKPFGHLLWVRDGTLMAQPFDPEQGQTTGEPVERGGRSRLRMTPAG